MNRISAFFCLAVLLALPASARTRPHYGGTLRVEIEGDPWQRPNGLARRLVLDGLTTLSADGLATPALATEWTSENDSHRWQFRLRPGVHFHDGSPLTSTAVVASLTGACATDCPWTAAHAVGSLVVFTSDVPMPNLPSLLAGDQYLISLASPADGKTPPGTIGTGPFQFAGINKDALTLTANDSSWQGRPFVDTLLLIPRKAIRDQWLDLSVGHADLVEVPAEQLRAAHEQRLTVLASPPVTLLALQVAGSGVLGNPNLRAAIALAIDRSALSNVIFQKQGEVTASLLPSELTGYGFLFPTERDLNKAHELRGGIAPPPLTITAEGGAAMQLAAQRIALNLRETGFSVQVMGSALHPDLALRRFPLTSNQPQAALEAMLRGAGHAAPVLEDSPVGVYRVERDFVDTHRLIPLLYLPRAYAVGGRVRDLRLSPDGTPLLAGVSLQDTP